MDGTCKLYYEMSIDRQLLKSTDVALKTRLRQDRDNYCQQVAERAASLPPSLVLQKMRCIGVMGKSKRREAKPLQTVTAQDGSMLTDEEAINARWQQHFEQLEDGVSCSKEDLLTQCVTLQRNRARVVPQWSDIPTLLDVEESFRLNKTGRASYFDGLPTDICHLFPQVMAKVYYALALKQTLHIAEPVTLKGGVLIHAYKGRGLATECSSYRSLMVSSVLSKSLHRILRSKCMRHFEPVGMPLQLGGLPGKSVSQGAHALLSYAAACRRQNLSMHCSLTFGKRFTGWCVNTSSAMGLLTKQQRGYSRPWIYHMKPSKSLQLNYMVQQRWIQLEYRNS